MQNQDGTITNTDACGYWAFFLTTEEEEKFLPQTIPNLLFETIS